MSSSPVGEPHFESVSAGRGRTWVQTVETANHLVEGASWDVVVEGRLLAVDGASWVVVENRIGATGGGSSFPGLRVLAVEFPEVEVLEGPDLELPPALSRYRSGMARLLGWPQVFKSGQMIPVGGTVNRGRYYTLSAQGAEWIGLPFASSFVEIPWRIEAYRLPVAAAR